MKLLLLLLLLLLLFLDLGINLFHHLCHDQELL
jgi:hypothetical protein